MSDSAKRKLMAVKTIAVATAALFVGLAGASAQTTLIQNARIYTLTGAQYDDVVENGDILIRDGVISAIGQDLATPEGASVVEASGKIVTPGLFAAWSQLGLAEIGLDDEANDSRPRGNYALSAALDPRDAFNPSSSLIPVNRAGGVTRALVSPSAGSKIFAGKAMIVDLSGRPESVTKPYVAQFVQMGSGGASREGNTRLGAWATLREYLDEAQRYAADPRGYFTRRRDTEYAIADLEALGPVLSGAAPLIVGVNRAADIRTLIRLKQNRNLNVIILGGSEAWKVARELSIAGIPVILDPTANLPSQFEDLGATLQNAARLNAAGVTVVFDSTAAASGSHNLYLTTQLAGNAVANGLPYGAALAAMTINPAKIYGVNATHGSLEVGKVADIVVWDGDPLELASRPTNVFIGGRATSLDNRQDALRERYKDLESGDLPFAYRGRN